MLNLRLNKVAGAALQSDVGALNPNYWWQTYERTSDVSLPRRRAAISISAVHAELRAGRGMTEALKHADPSLAWTPAFAGPERLVGLGFRYWLAGYRTGEIGCWERAWRAYTDVMGPTSAKHALSDLSNWVRAVNLHAQRPLETPAVDCDGFCRDECVAIAMIAACQHNACPAMRACAFSLLGCSMIDEVVQGAESFAATMRGADQVLLPSYVHGASLLAMRPATRVSQ